MNITPTLAMVGFPGGDWWEAIPIVIVLYFISVWIFQLLWDWTMPELFGLRPITFWQAFRLLLIAGMLFGSGSFIRFHG